MSITDTSLDSFSALARALGILSDSGPNGSWFTDPMGGTPSNPHGLKTVLGDDGQRDALVQFVDEVLGPPDEHVQHGQKWVPLFHETSPDVTIFAVLEPVTGAVRVGLGVVHSTGDAAPRLNTTVHVPLFHVPRGGADSRPSGGPLPKWSLIGHPGGRIVASVDARFDDGPAAPGTAFLGGASVTLGIPTCADDSLDFSLTLTDLQLPGATTPQSRTLDVDSLNDLGSDVFDFVVGLVRQQIDALDLNDDTFRHIAGLAGILGLRTVSDLPALPLADLPHQGLTALVAWIESVLGDDNALDVWLGQLALLVGGTAVPDRNAVEFSIGSARLLLGMRVAPGTGGHAVLVPWVELTWSPSDGADVSASVDLLRADTGTGHVQAVPGLRVEAVFGAQAHNGSALLTGTPSAGTLRIGLALDDHQRPAFALTLHDVVMPGGRKVDLLDLSSPDAALDAANSVVSSALSSALDGFGDAGALVASLLGISAPAGVAALKATDVLADPLAAIRGYWQRLAAKPAAMAEVLGNLRALVQGVAAAAVPGSGSIGDPWRIDLVDGIGLRFWGEGSDLIVAVGVAVKTPLVDDLAVAVTADFVLLRADLDAGHVSLACRASGEIALRPVGNDPLTLDLDIATLSFAGAGVRVQWAPAAGLHASVTGDGLTASYRDPRTLVQVTGAVPLPVIAADGTVTFAPDWDEVEGIVAALLGRTQSQVVDLLLDLLGWRGSGAHLSLAALMADPGTAVASWAKEWALDCAHLRAVLSPVATLLSGGRLNAPIGLGRSEDPYRCPVAGNPRAPGVVAWTVPGCPPWAATLGQAPTRFTDLRDGLIVPDGPALSAGLSAAAETLPELADLIEARSRLGEGLTSLMTRWSGTDGVVAAPNNLPADVTSLVLDGFSYAELVSAGRLRSYVLQNVVAATGAMVHVGAVDGWLSGQAPASALDATVATPPTLPASADGDWFVMLPTPSAAAALRPDGDAIAAQADRLATVLSSRTSPVVVVAYGPAGAAAVRAANGVAQVAAVITVGTPWSDISVLSLTTGLGGDALRLLDRLIPDDLPPWNDELTAHGTTPLRRAIALVRHARETGGATDLPSAAGETRRAGLEVHAVFGAVAEEDVARGVAALVVSGVEQRARAADDRAAAESGVPRELHVGVDVPVLELDLGGLIVGLGAAVDLLSVKRSGVQPLREVVTTLRIAVTDGWLVGGPGATQNDLELRWLDARIHVPLDGSQGSSEFVLHDARAYTAYRERWVVRSDGDGTDATTALPEVRILLSELAARLRTASPDLASLLTTLGILRADGLDPDGFDHLLFDPAATLRPRITAHASDVAEVLRNLIGAPTTGLAATAIRVGGDNASVDIDLSSGALTAHYSASVPGLPPVTVGLTMAGPSVLVSGALGGIDDSIGGLRIVGSAGTSGTSVSIESRVPGALTSTSVGLYPVVDTTGLTLLARTAVPAVVLQAVSAHCRVLASDDALSLLDSALSALGMLSDVRANGGREVLLPFGLMADPGAWIRLRVDPFGAVVTALDALAPIVVPNRPQGAPGWPLTDELTIDYAVVAGQLRLSAMLDLAAQIDGRAIATSISGGLSISPTGTVQPAVSASALIDQSGLSLAVAPSITLDLLRAAPATPIRIYPAGSGLGPAIGAAAESAVRLVLNALVDHRSDAGPSVVKAVAETVFELGTALDLLEADHFTDARIANFAQDPSLALQQHLPAIVSGGVSALARALDPGQTVVVVAAAVGGRRRITFGASGIVHVDLDGTAPAIELGGRIDLFDRDHERIGTIAVERLRLTPTGIQVEVRGGPFLIKAGDMTLRPLVVARAGISAQGFSRMISLGVAIDDDGRDSAEFRWSLDTHVPAMSAITRDVDGVETGVDTDVPTVALKVLGIAVSLASTVLTDKLGDVISDRATQMLQGVLFANGDRTIDSTLFADLTEPDALLGRLKALAWNCATNADPLSVTIDSTVTIGLAAGPGAGSDKVLGVNVTLEPGKSFVFPTGDVKVALEVDSTWISPEVDPGLSVYVLTGPDARHLAVAPGFAIGGIGLRFTKSAGPLLDLGSVGLDGIAFHVYAEATAAGAGGGANIELVGLAFAPGGSGSGVASSIMNDVGTASANNRPVFAPSFAVQKHPGKDLAFSLRAGEPPGPWWIVVQRQLGPLYVDRIGFNSVEANGQVTEVSLLFNGQLSLFGLQAAVDRLMIKWNGGDVLAISSWSVDLMGLAISADMAGISLAGGLLKTDDAGVVSYVGMLVGRFATYGLSVFGGYTNDHGHASFFIFGAVTGPIGGPPAFFLTGLGGGLGINRGLKIPTDLSQFGTFPFIQALDPAAHPPAKPMDELKRLSEYFPHQMGSFWFAAGISFTSFSLVDGVAVVAVAFGDGLTIDLLGLARMALPRPGAALVSIELALLAHFSTSEGIFLIKAQLTDNSWLLYPEVRLTGGFAFAVWWKGPNAGQFVLTMGGYHPSFHRDGYPDVPRLGIMWRISDVLVIKGGSYFALTSEALMAGVAVEASLDLGWVWAKVAFGADGIVYFDPFWFEVSAYARISAGIELDLGFFSISLSITIGATITVWGPDFAGRAEFEIGPCTIPIEFGSPRKVDPKRLIWTEFVAKYLEDGGAGARALSSITGRGTLPTATGGQTGAPSADGSQGLPFQVFAEFEITFTTTIPTSRFEAGAPLDVPIAVAGQPSLLGLSPMGAHHASSTVTIRLWKLDEVAKVYKQEDGMLALLVEQFATDAYPLGVWGTPPDTKQPVKPLPSGDVITAGKQLTLVAGVQMPAVGPVIDYHQVTFRRDPLPLLATGAERKKFLNVASKLSVPDPATAEAALTAAAGQLFADRQVGDQTLVRGGHSALAAAAFRQDRSAPPMFGTLTDGLAPLNGDSGTREQLDTPPPTVARELRLPFVAGHFTGGVGAVVRPDETTVADGALKRRPAPTLDSARGRLALHLPVSLTRAAPPALGDEGTVVASGSVPRTDAPGSMRSFIGGRVGSPALQGLVSGLGGPSAVRQASPKGRSRARARAESAPDVLPSGDLVVLQCPDAHLDVDADRRPSVEIAGRARVTVILGRTVLVDADVADASVVIPSGATHVGVHSDGSAEASNGLAGWHDRSRVARIGAQSAIAAGCVLSVDAAGGAPTMQWDTAGAVVHEAREVTTRFSRPVTTVAVSLTGTSPRSLTPTQLHLVGAEVATDRAGNDVPPTAVTLGDTSVLVYSIVPDEGADSVSVSVTAGADWVVSGVVGSTDSPSDLARLLARQRLSGVVAKLLAIAGPGCSAQWLPATTRRSRSPRRPTS